MLITLGSQRRRLGSATVRFLIWDSIRILNSSGAVGREVFRMCMRSSLSWAHSWIVESVGLSETSPWTGWTGESVALSGISHTTGWQSSSFWAVSLSASPKASLHEEHASPVLVKGKTRLQHLVALMRTFPFSSPMENTELTCTWSWCTNCRSHGSTWLIHVHVCYSVCTLFKATLIWWCGLRIFYGQVWARRQGKKKK